MGFILHQLIPNDKSSLIIMSLFKIALFEKKYINKIQNLFKIIEAQK